MNSATASDNEVWPGRGALSCAAAILFAGYVAAVLLPPAVDVPMNASAPETGEGER